MIGLLALPEADLSREAIERLPVAQQMELLELLEERRRRNERRKLATYYPDDGPLRRELYPRHLEFFAAGARHRERLLLAANRIGKTEGVGGYELTLHLTGRYPHWWRGRRFDRPIRAWAAGDTMQTVKEILQSKLLGPPGAFGTGLIPGDDIVKTVSRSGMADAVAEIRCRHQSGGVSVLGLKSFDQGREVYQGTEQDVIWLDEEPPIGIYGECLTRTMTTNGAMILTFTPLRGLSAVVMAYLPGGKIPEVRDGGKFVVTATWDDAPHLSAQQKAELWESLPPHEREARSKGIPQLGSGAIYPVSESDATVPDFQIPAFWPRLYGLDVGWNRTAAVWGAWNREADILYLTSEYVRGQAEPVIHAEAIKSRGAWIPGVVDPAAQGSSQTDGRQLLQQYRQLGLDLRPANNAVEIGIQTVWLRLSTGRLKVFKSLVQLLGEYRVYRRDEQGRIVKDNDHLMDAARYLVMALATTARLKPENLQITPRNQGNGSGY